MKSKSLAIAVLLPCFVLSLVAFAPAGHSGGSSYSGSHYSGSYGSGSSSGHYSSNSHGRSSAGTVHVHGYTRKDGTYVQPYTRSAPGSKSGVASDRIGPASTSALGSSTHDTGNHAAVGVERDSNARIKRSEAAKEAFMRQSGYPHGRPGYVVDHIIPLKRGGADTPSNMQWQSKEEAKQKDKWE